MDFGAELRRRRVAAGMSLGELARATHYSKGYLSKIETGQRVAGHHLRRQCDAVLRANGRLLGHGADDRVGDSASDRSGSPPTAPGPAWSVHLQSDGAVSLYFSAYRGDLSEFLGAPLMTAAAPPVMEDDPDHLADTLTQLLGNLRQIGHRATPDLVLPSTALYVGGLQRLLRHGSSGSRLASVIGRYAEYAGWLAQETGDVQAARWWTDQAATFADHGDDPDMVAYALVRHAEIALRTDNAARAIALTQRAQQVPGHSARVRALALHRQAQGHALIGEATLCLRTLQQAGELGQSWSASAAETTLPLGPSTVADLDAVVEGWCRYELGQPRAAADLLEQAIAKIPVQTRTRGLFSAHLAAAQAAAGEIDHACFTGRQALTLAVATGSSTTLQVLGVLARELARRHRHPPARELYAELTSALRTSTR